MVGKRGRFFFSYIMIITAFIVSIMACNLPEGLVEDVTDALASLELFVATTGDDGADCQTPETACQTIWRAVNLANGMSNAVIRISPGTYNETHDLKIDQPMSILGEDGVIVNRLANIPGIPSTFVISPPDNSLVRIHTIEIHSTNFGMTVSSGRVELDGLNFTDIWNHGLHVSPDVERASISIKNSDFSQIQGSPIVSRDADVTISLKQVTITENNSTPIINYGSTINLDGVVISNNQSQSRFPTAIMSGLDNDLGTGTGGIIRISNSTIANNTSQPGTENNIAISNSGELLEITNSTISGNTGSGIGVGRGETILTHVTIANHPDVGIYGPLSLDIRVTLRNSLVVYNGRDCDFRTIYTSGIPATRTVIDGSIDSDNTCREPLVEERAAWDFYPGVDGVLRDNGGGGLTHALLIDSPVIDSVDCISGLAGDQRGVTRPQGIRCDAGAYEREAVLGEPPLMSSSTPLAIQQGLTPNATLPVLPSQIAVTATSSPFVRFIMNGNCRSGPGTVYKVITALEEGAETPAEGRNQESTWWLLNLNGARCWVSATVVESFGPMTGLPVVPAPPTPVPTAIPTAVPTKAIQLPASPQQLYVEKQVCTGETYSVALRWLDASDNEQGFSVYRDGGLISSLGGNSTTYTDNPSFGGPYTYGVESYNAAGASSRVTVVDPGCIP